MSYTLVGALESPLEKFGYAHICFQLKSAEMFVCMYTWDLPRCAKVYAVNIKIVNIEISEFYIDSIRNLMCIQFSEKLMQFDF